MTEWILADAHGGADEETDRALVATIDRARGIDLVILGDLFLAWAAPARFLTPLQAEVMRALEAHRERAKVIFVVGNRDYLAEAQLGRAFDEVILQAKVLEIGGVPTYLTHGDRIDPDDHLYRAWFALSRNAVSRRLMERVPPRFAERIARNVEGALAKTNARYKSGGLPRARLEALGARAAAAGAERAIIGHFHTPTTIEAARPVIIAPPFLETRQILVAEDGRLDAIDPLR